MTEEAKKDTKTETAPEKIVVNDHLVVSKH